MWIKTPLLTVISDELPKGGVKYFSVDQLVAVFFLKGKTPLFSEELSVGLLIVFLNSF